MLVLQEALLKAGKKYNGGLNAQIENIDKAIKTIISEPRTRKTQEFLDLDEKRTPRKYCQ